jgi:hypothetical protein
LLGSNQQRIPTEDEVLKKAFGREWEEWARKVPVQLFIDLREEIPANDGKPSRSQFGIAEGMNVTIPAESRAHHIQV